MTRLTDGRALASRAGRPNKSVPTYIEGEMAMSCHLGQRGGSVAVVSELGARIYVIFNA